MQTMFAPAAREDAGRIRAQHRAFLEYGCAAMLDAVPFLVLVLNDKRQAVFANRKLVEAVADGDPDKVLGKRPGELMGCAHADKEAGGCGTTVFCRQCGAARTILSALAGTREISECSMLRVSDKGEQALDLSVSGEPFAMDGESYTIFTIADVSHEKRRRALERIFFHDILNTAGGLRGLSEFLIEEAPGELKQDAQVIHTSMERLVDEIISQKELLAAESGELTVSPMQLKSSDLVQSVCAFYARHPAAEGKTIKPDPEMDVVWFESDYALVSRILGNMVKNALEACGRGERVMVSCSERGDRVRFEVRNPGEISEAAKLSIFKRSFSTKGAGRGLGTYSIKLLAERYLDGEVGFSSLPGEETVFFVELPAALPGSP